MFSHQHHTAYSGVATPLVERLMVKGRQRQTIHVLLTSKVGGARAWLRLPGGMQKNLLLGTQNIKNSHEEETSSGQRRG